MKPPVETIRLGKQSRDQLAKIKRSTGIENWNVICRWAFCVSIKELSDPSTKRSSTEDGVEISWKVFAGEYGTVYSAILALRTPSGLDQGAQLHAHIRRGLGYLASSKGEPIRGFLGRWSL